MVPNGSFAVKASFGSVQTCAQTTGSTLVQAKASKNYHSPTLSMVREVALKGGYSFLQLRAHEGRFLPSRIMLIDVAPHR